MISTPLAAKLLHQKFHRGFRPGSDQGRRVRRIAGPSQGRTFPGEEKTVNFQSSN